MAVKILGNSIFHIYIRIRLLFPIPLRINSVLGEKSFNSFVEFVYISFYFFVRCCSYGTEKLNEKDERSRIFTSTIAATSSKILGIIFNYNKRKILICYITKLTALNSAELKMRHTNSVSMG
jgi:hypothetical protein